LRAPKRPTRPSIPRRRRPLQSAGYRPTDTANSRLIAKTHLRNGINGRELTPTIGKRLYSRRRWLRDQSRSRLQRQTRSAAMPDPERRYTKFEIAEQLRVLAKHSGEPNKGKLLRLAALHERDTDLVSGSQRAIVESRTLLAQVDSLFR